MELSVMDRINLILSDPEKATMTLAQIVSEEIREFKKSEQYQIILEAESYYRNRSSVQKKTVDVANRSNAKIERPILKKLVDQKANYLLSKPWTVDTESGEYGEALNKVFDQTFRRKIKSLGKGAVKSGIAWIQPYFDDASELAFMRVPSTEVVPLWRDSERTKLDAFIRFYDQIIYVGTRKHTITHAEFWWTGGVRYTKVKKNKKAARASAGKSIEKRDPEIDTREEVGHWEMDCVEGKKKTKETLLVLSERKARKEIMIKMKDQTAGSVVAALDRLERRYGTLFYKIFQTITVDNGSEFADVEGLERSCRRKGKRTTVF